MTTREALREATATLAKAGVDSPRSEATLLLGHALGKPKEFVLTHPEYKLTAAQKRRFFALIERRAKREPFAYITGHKEFYGLDFLVNHHTLIPRPETELLIETICKKLDPKRSTLNPIVIDVGTGSGAIAITLAKLLPRATVYATDISNVVLRIARKNAKLHDARVHFKKGNLLTPLKSQKLNVKSKMLIVANLPYLPTTTWRAAEPEVKKYEPRTALDGGPDGLKYYRQLINQIKQLLITYYLLRITLIIEIDPRQSKLLTALIHKIFPRACTEIKKDLAGQNRVLITTLPVVRDQSPKPMSHRR